MAGHYSQTKLKQYFGCPHAYKLERIDKVETVKSEPLIKGSGFHRVAGHYLKHLVEKNLATDISAVREIGRAALMSDDGRDGAVPAIYHTEILDLAEKWAGGYVLNTETVVDIENLTKIPFGGAQWWFVIDLLQIEGARAIITDWKTDHNLPAEKDVAKDLQLRVYCYCVKALYPQVKEFEVNLYYARYGVNKTARLDLSDVDKAEEDMAAGVAQIAADKTFKPTPGAGCAWCGVSHACEVFGNVGNLAPGVIVASRDQAFAAAEELALLEKAVKERKEALKLWCAKAGNMTVNGLEWAYWPSVSKKYDPADLVALIADNPDIIPLLSIDGRKRVPETVVDVLEAIVTETTSTAFKSKKVTS